MQAPMRTAGSTLLALMLLVTAACSDSVTGPIPIDEVEFNPALGIDLEEFQRLPSGVYIQTVAAGEGASAGPGDQVTVRYEVRLPDNTLVDASPPDLSFVLGSGQVIPGFDIGVDGMTLAEQRRFIVPSSLAYGASGAGPIPPNSTLIFDVTVLSIG